ncbi:hypothetical protein MCUN1_002859 [Malassezia cuniculi]|uniref:Uncharacterized protein n=1 Tax=Malassezia cuniculi TaxID=948313 RepID=A0AAF0ES62_9BASI|nr:hypothetical protein MCUN1_002859 [Malassezia cuniculi]
MACATTQRILLLAISALSVALGVYVSYQAIHAPPKYDFDRLGALSVSQMRGLLRLPNLTNSEPGSLVYKTEHLLYLLVLIFAELCSTLIGSASFLFISSCMGPVLTFMYVEATKPGHSFLIGGLVVVFVTALGQLICVGASVPIVYIPLYALTRALNLNEVHPRPAGGPRTKNVVKLVGTIVGASTVASVVVPLKSVAWPWANIAFQVFPIAVLILPLYSLTASRETQTIRQSRIYHKEKFQSALIYWISLIVAAKPVYQLLNGESILINDSVKLIWWDQLGVSAVHILFVLVNAVADGCNSVHKKSCGACVSGVFGAIVSALVFGPGYTFYNYIAAREEAVESIVGKAKSQ